MTPTPPAPRRPLSAFGLLTRHFWGRFFDKESLSPQGDPQANVVQILGILAVPGAFFVLLFRPLTLVRWDLVGIRYLFLSYSMIVMGFLMVFEWDALFPDRRDYQILSPLPLRLHTLFLAKISALAMLLGIFLLDINFFSALFWPGIDAGPGTYTIMATHITALLAGGLFAALAIASVQGILMNLLSATLFRRVSVWIQTGLTAILVMLFFVSPLIGMSIQALAKKHSPLLYWFPGFWFVGLYEWMRPATGNPDLLAVGRIGAIALASVAILFLIAYLPGYRRHARKILEMPEPGIAGSGRLQRFLARIVDRTLLRNPVERAVFHFINETITRSTKHRLFLATYGGLGAALGVISLGSGDSGLLRLPLTLSFILVSGLRAVFNVPSELRANWAFQVSETRGATGYLEATRKWILFCAILPLFVLIAPMEFACFPWTTALFHLAFGITLSALLVEILFFGFRKVPFTCAYFPGKVNMAGLSVIYIYGFTTYSGTMASFESLLGDYPNAAIAFFTIAWLARWIAARWRRAKMGPAAALDYEDAGDPVIRTLGVTTR